MRVVLVLSITFFFTSTFGQKITHSFHNVSLSNVLEIIADKDNVRFAYDNAQTDSIIVNKNFSGTLLNDAIVILLEQSNLSYHFINGVYVIVPRDEINKENIKSEKLKYYRITVLVKDNYSGEHLPYASAMVKGTNRGMVANADGFFSLWFNTPDSVKINISFIGYQDTMINIIPKQTYELNTVSLRIKPHEMPVAVITEKGQQFVEINKDPGSLTFNPSKIIDMPSLAEQDIVTSLQLIPGVDGTSETSSGLSIRHSPSDKNLILYDGMTIYQIDHFYGVISSFNSKAIRDIKLYKSGFDARYGSRSSSVVEITGKSGNMNKASFEAGVDLWSVDAMLELPVIKEKASLLFTARRSYTDYIQSTLFDKLFDKTRYELQNFYPPQEYLTAFKSEDVDPSFYFYDVTGKFVYKPTEKDVISISSYKGSDIMNFVKPDFLPFINEKTNLHNQGLSTRWSRKWNDRYYHNFLMGVSQYGAAIHHSDTNLIPTLDGKSVYTLKKNYDLENTLSDLVINFQNQYRINPNIMMELGLSSNLYKTYLMYDKSSVGDTSVFSRLVDVKKDAQLYSGYLQANVNYKKFSMIKLGIRYNYYSLTKDFRPEPRVSAVYEANDKFRLKVMGGIYNQYVNKLVNQSDYRTLWTLSDSSNYPVVNCWHYMIGGEYDITSSLTVDAEFYYKNTFGIVYDSIIYFKKSGVDTLYSIETDHALHFTEQEVYGMDLMLKKNYGNYQAWLAYTLSYVRCKGNYINNADYFPYNSDQRHEIKMFNAYNYKHWNFALTMIVGSGKPWSYYSLNIDLDYEPYVINDERLPVYHRMDLGTNYSYDFKVCKIKAGVNIFNVYNFKNKRYIFMKLKENAGIEAASGNTPLEEVDIYGLGFTPNVFVNVRF